MQTQRIRVDNRKCRLTYWLNRRLYSAPTILWKIIQTRHNHPVGLHPPPLHRRGISWCRHATTTPSGFTRHPSTGGELAGADTTQPPRRASPATPPQEGNCLVQMQCVGVVWGIWWHGVVEVVRNGTFGRIYKSGPTIFVSLVGTQKTTPSGFARHPSTGGELLSADAMRWGGLGNLVAWGG